MDKRTHNRLKLLLFICGLMGLAVLPFAASYSRATIANPASVKITDTANALIAVQMLNREICFPGNLIRGNVINNMGVPLTRLEATKASFPPSILSVGAATSFTFNAPATSGLYDGVILAEWHNGSATIPYSVTIDVIDPNDLHVDWDENAAELTVTNGSHHALEVIVDNVFINLQSGASAQFQRAGDSTTVIFSLGGRRNSASAFSLGEERNYSVSIATQLPLPAEPEVTETPPEEEPPASPSIDVVGEEAILEEPEAVSAGENNLPDSDLETTEVIIET